MEEENLRWCECIAEPRGEGGLEGYVKGELYRYQLMEEAHYPPYCRVYPDQDNPEYYETCGPVTFSKFFTPALPAL